MANIFIDAHWRGDKVNKGISETEGKMKGLGSVAKAALAGFSTAVAVRELKKLYMAGVQDIGVWAPLTAAVKQFGGTSQDVKKVHNEIDRLQSLTGIDKSDIGRGFDWLLRTTKDIDKSVGALSISMDFAAAKHMDVAQAATT